MVRVKQESHVLEVRPIDRSIESEIARQYREAGRRILFLDYDGTLVPIARRPEMAVPDQGILGLLERLAADPKNTVVIISGRQREFLDQWFGNLRVVLAAEHGGFLRAVPAGWVNVVEADPAWEQQVLPVLQRYADRCPGAFIEKKSLSLAWHYRTAEPQIAQLRSQELKEELGELVSHDGKLHVLEGHKVIEIKHAGYDKGTVVPRLLDAAAYDFVLALGDDKTDEDLFRVLPADAWTVKIGTAVWDPKRDSSRLGTLSLAKYRLARQQDVVQLINRLLDGPSAPAP